MTPIYDANTLRKVSSDARLAEYNRIKNNYIPAALYKVNEANFAAANAGFQSAAEEFNLLRIGLSTQENQDYFKIGLKSELEELGFKVAIISDNGMIKVTCVW